MTERVADDSGAADAALVTDVGDIERLYHRPNVRLMASKIVAYMRAGRVRSAPDDYRNLVDILHAVVDDAEVTP